MKVKIGDESKMTILMVVLGVTLALSLLSAGLEWERSRGTEPDRDIVFLLETGQVDVRNIQLLRVSIGKSLVSEDQEHVEVVRTIDATAELGGLIALLKRVKMGRKYLNHPTTVAEFPVRIRAADGDYFAHVQYLKLKKELTIQIRAGGIGEKNANNTNIYHLDGREALELSQLLRWDGQKRDNP